MKRFPWLLVLVCAFCLFAPTFQAQAALSFTKIATNITAATYSDTSCPKSASCTYEVTAVANGQESLPSAQVTVANSGPTGTIVLTWTAGACPAGETCATPGSYNVYLAAPPIPPTALAAAGK